LYRVQHGVPGSDTRGAASQNVFIFFIVIVLNFRCLRCVIVIVHLTFLDLVFIIVDIPFIEGNRDYGRS
jgi:hypothetical protein